MTHTRIFMTTLAAVALLSCGKEQQKVEAPAVGFPKDGVVRIAANAGELQTRGDGTNGASEYAGTTLGLFIDYGNGNKYSGSNVKWTKGTDWTPEKQMLWKDSTTTAKIYAYAPYVDGQTDPASVEFSIPGDQTGGTLAADLVTWPKGDFIPDNSKNNDFSKDGKILISFSHRLVKLTFNFEKGNQFGSDVTVEEAVLLGTVSKVVCNLTKTNETFKPNDATSLDIKLHKVSDLKWEGIFYPGDGQKPDAKMLQVKMSNGVILNYFVPAGGLVSPGFMSGTAYKMTMRLGKDKIELAKDGITVGEWGTGSDLTGGEAGVDSKADVWDGKTVTPFSTGDEENPLGGSETNPIVIESAAQLAYLAQSVNGGESYAGKYFKLTKNIALADKPWTPIGGCVRIDEGHWKERPFKGNFDGGGNTIYGLKIVAEKNNYPQYLGLFGLVNESSNGPETYIKNLKISLANVLNENQYSGILCGKAYYVDISGVEVSGNVTANGWCGGLVGAISNSAISACKAKVKVTSTGSAGGICAESVGLELSGCSVSSSEIVGTVQTGGLLGMIYRKIDVKDCTVDASLKANGVGGLFGCFTHSYNNETRSAQNCTMTGTITVVKGSGDEYGGGIVGWLSSDACSFENCGFDGTIVMEEGVDPKGVGAAIGIDNTDNCTFTGCWYNKDKTGDLSAVGKGNNYDSYGEIEPRKSGK